MGWASPHQAKAEKAASGFRGHGLVQHPTRPNSLIMFARRPGTEIIEVDIRSGEILQRVNSQSDRHLFGHGCFSADGHTLFTTEAEFVSGQGVIGVRDADSLVKKAEFKSYGIGPHELKLTPDGKKLAITNGGIRTHPETGREKLNLENMQSSLTYIDARTGAHIHSYQVTEPKASIRHLDIADDGTVAIAMQLQREAAQHNNVVALGAIHKPGQEIRLLQTPQTQINQMQDYVGSVAINNLTRTAGFTSPRGSLVAFWDIDTGVFRKAQRMQEVCGITVSADQSHFIISSSFGRIRHIRANTLEEDRQRRFHDKTSRWDNHMITVSL